VGFGVAAIEHFISCVVNDTEPAVTGEDGLRAARVVYAMEESARTGHAVELHQ
jgi:predicted dehydrogenase